MTVLATAVGHIDLSMFRITVISKVTQLSVIQPCRD